MTPIVIGIPTRNRAHIWERRLMLDSLAGQSDRGFRLVIADDSSTDDTRQVLPDLFHDAPFPVRLLEVEREHRLRYGDSAWADNALFAATPPGSIFVHLDDDGWVHPELVAWCRTQFATHPERICYGWHRFVNPSTLELVGEEPRCHVFRAGLTPIAGLCGGGALWTGPIDHIRFIGGQDMTHAQYRGGDGRLAWRLDRAGVKLFYARVAEMTFWHLGQTLLRRLETSQEPGDWRDFYRFPQRGMMGNLRTEADIQKNCPVVANGGLAFWDGLATSIGKESWNNGK